MSNEVFKTSATKLEEATEVARMAAGVLVTSTKVLEASPGVLEASPGVLGVSPGVLGAGVPTASAGALVASVEVSTGVLEVSSRVVCEELTDAEEKETTIRVMCGLELIGRQQSIVDCK